MFFTPVADSLLYMDCELRGILRFDNIQCINGKDLFHLIAVMLRHDIMVPHHIQYPLCRDRLAGQNYNRS